MVRSPVPGLGRLAHCWENTVMSSLTLLGAVLLVLVVVLVVALLMDLAHRYPKATTPMFVGLGGVTAIGMVVVPIVVR